MKYFFVVEDEVTTLKTKTRMSIEFIIDESVPVEIISHVSILTEKLNKAGIDVLATILKQEFNCRITNLKNSRVALEKRRQIAIDAILCEKALNNDGQRALTILETYFADKPKKIRNNDWLNKFEVGEEVLVYEGYIYRKGIINKINKSSLLISLYGYETQHDLDAITNQTHGTDKLIWYNFISKTIIKHNNNYIRKKGESEYYDKIFIEGKRDVDYGR